MFISRNIVNLMGRAGVYLEENDGNGNDLGGNADEKARLEAEQNKQKAEREAAEAAEAEAAKKRGDGKTPTDEEARLLKEVMKGKEQRKKLESDLEAATARLKDFEGLDVAALRKLADEQKVAEEKQLEAKGEWDRLKKRMADEHLASVTALQGKVKELEEALGQKESTINDMTVGSAFSSSKFISDETTLTAQKARVIYGAHFELEEGKVVGYDKPKGASNRTQLVDGTGNPVDFEAAMRKIIDADSDRDHLLKSGVKPGAKSTSTPVPAGKKDVNDSGKSSADKIASGLGKLMSGE